MNQGKKIIITGYYGNDARMTSKFITKDIVEALETVLTPSDTLIFNGSSWASCGPIMYKNKYKEQRVNFKLPTTYPFPSQSIVAKSYVLMKRRSGTDVLSLIQKMIEDCDVDTFNSFRSRDASILKDADAGIFFFLELNGKILTDNKYGGNLYRQLLKKKKQVHVFVIKPDGQLQQSESPPASSAAPAKQTQESPQPATQESPQPATQESPQSAKKKRRGFSLFLKPGNGKNHKKIKRQPLL